MFTINTVNFYNNYILLFMDNACLFQVINPIDQSLFSQGRGESLPSDLFIIYGDVRVDQLITMIG